MHRGEQLDPEACGASPPMFDGCVAGFEASCELLPEVCEWVNVKEWRDACLAGWWFAAIAGCVIVSEELDSDGDVWSWGCQVAVFECLVDNVKGSGPAWLFKIGGHAPNGIDLPSLCGRCGVVLLLQTRLMYVW